MYMPSEESDQPGHKRSSHYAVYARAYKNINTQGSSPNVVKVISIP